MWHCASHCLVMFARSAFGLRCSRACPPQSSRSHKRFSLLVNPLLFTFDSCHDLTPVVTNLLRRLALDLLRRDQTAAEDMLRVVPRSLIISAVGRNPARYCASNARKAAATVDPMPTIPSSTLGPSSAIQSSPRTNNRGRRTAVRLPG